MKLAFVSLAALAAPGLCRQDLQQRDSPAVLRLGLKRNRVVDPISRDRRRFRRDVVDVDISGYSMGGDLYCANLTLGTPPQRVEVSVDTGSSDLWVVDSDNSICQESDSQCDSLGTYDPLDSGTYDDLSSSFSIKYGDESWAEGYYAVDSVEMAGASVPHVQFGIATNSSIDRGILGLGYSSSYSNFPALLAQHHITNSNAYSLWLNRLGDNEGNLLFGGIDTAHYQGSLRTLPIVPYNTTAKTYHHPWVTLTGLSVESTKDRVSRSYPQHPSFPLVVLLDSGASISYLPAALVKQIYSDLDVHFYTPQQFGYVPCTSYLQGRENYTLTFSFSDLTIRVPLSELVLTNAITYQNHYLDINGERSCLFGIAPSISFFPILGDSFLRSAYVVFDLENNQVSMAQTNHDTPLGEDIIEIVGSVPGATPVADPVTTATIQFSGVSLSLPAGYTNSPIFPTTTSPSSAEATTTSSGTGSGTGTATTAIVQSLAGRVRWNTGYLLAVLLLLI